LWCDRNNDVGETNIRGHYSEKARFPGLLYAIAPWRNYYFLRFFTASPDMAVASNTQKPKNIAIGTKIPGKIILSSQLDWIYNAQNLSEQLGPV
jgi:hypothetical protein